MLALPSLFKNKHKIKSKPLEMTSGGGVDLKNTTQTISNQASAF